MHQRQACDLCPSRLSDADPSADLSAHQPSTHRVYAKSPRGHDIEVGGVCKKKNAEGKPYYTLSIKRLGFNANLGRFPGQDDPTLQAIIEWEPRD
nr:DUF736 domain-containing protein [Rhizobium sullae]